MRYRSIIKIEIYKDRDIIDRKKMAKIKVCLVNFA